MDTTSPTSTVVADSDPSAAISSPTASMASSKPTSSFAPIAQPSFRAKAATRTYGRRVLDNPLDSTAPTSIESEAGKDASSKSDGRSNALQRQSTVMVPETDFDGNLGSVGEEDEPMASTSRRDEDAERATRAAIDSSSSSPGARGEQQHSTDPTSEEDDLAPRTKPTAGVEAGDLESDSDSSDDDEGGETSGALAQFLKGKSVAEMMAEIDNESDEDDQQDPQVTTVPFPRGLAGESSLTSLDTTSQSTARQLHPTAIHSSSSQQAPTKARAPVLQSESELLSEIESTLPPLTSTLEDTSMAHDDDEEDEEESPVFSRSLKPKSKPRKRIIDSDEEEDDNEPPEDDVPFTSEDELRDRLPSDESIIDANFSDDAPVAKKDRLAALAKKRAPPPAPVAHLEKQKDRSRSVSVAPAEESSKGKDGEGKEKEKKAGRAKGNKNLEDAEARQTAAALRGQDARLQPRVKKTLKITDVLNKRPSLQRPISSHQPSREPKTNVVTISSDSIIESADSPLRPTLSAKAQGKLRAGSPSTDTIVRRVAVPHPFTKPVSAVPVEEEEEEELPTLDEMVRRQDEAKAKAKAAALLKERKLAAARALVETAKADSSSSDDDLEIETFKPPPARKSTTHHDFDLNSSPARLSNSARKIRSIGGPQYAHLGHDHSDDQPSDSQFADAGKSYGRNLGLKQQVAAPRRASKKGRKPPVAEIDNEVLNNTLWSKIRFQNHTTATTTRTEARRKESEREVVVPTMPEKVDVRKMLEKKKVSAEAAHEVDLMEEEEDDPDYEEEETRGDGSGEEEGEEEDEAMGSGEEEGGEEEETTATTSQKENVSVEPEADEEEEEEAVVARGRKVQGRARVAFASDDEEVDDTTNVKDDSAAPAEAGRVAFPSLLDDNPDRGFSQFFDSQFSQDVGNVNDEEGFHRHDDDDSAAPAPTLLGHLFIGATQRAEDAELLENRGGFDGGEPNTPREAPAPRFYVNKQGLMTQTRPANLFDSPLDSPSESSIHRPTYSAPNSESQTQTMTQTQLEATQTPTQVSKNPLRRTNAAMLEFPSYGSITATEPEATIVEEDTQMVDADDEDDEEEEEEEEEETLPSAAQAPSTKNAFEIMLAAQKAPAATAAPVEGPAQPAKKAQNAFIANEADMSDEEEGALGRGSGDEDETGLDAELESLVDNEEVDRDLADQQDDLVDKLFADDLAQDEAKALAKAQAIADGKDRQRKRGIDIDDDDFDDEYGVSRRVGPNKHFKAGASTSILNKPQYAAFGAHKKDGVAIQAKQGEYDFLSAPIDERDQYEEDEEDESEYDEEQQVSRKRITRVEATAMALEMGRKREAGALVIEEYEFQSEIKIGLSSSPAPMFKFKNKTMATVEVAPVKAIDDYEELDSQYTFHRPELSTKVQYKFDSKDDSQGAGSNGTTAGANSAVTSFAKSGTKGGKALIASDSRGNNKSGNTRALGAKPSKFGFRAQNGFS